MDKESETARETPKYMAKMERLQSDEPASDESLQDISLISGLEEVEASFDGAFDGTKITSVFEVNEREDIAFKNAVARSDKRFELALGINLLKKQYFDLKPVSEMRTLATRGMIAILTFLNRLFSIQIKS